MEIKKDIWLLILFTASVGRYHNAAVTKKNELYVWGANESGQVGDGSTSDQEEPVLIFSDAKTISLGDRHSAAILTNDDLYVWGKNKNGQVGDGTTKNTSDPIKVLENVREVVLSGYSSYAVTNDGILYVVRSEMARQQMCCSQPRFWKIFDLFLHKGLMQLQLMKAVSCMSGEIMSTDRWVMAQLKMCCSQ